MGKEQEQHPQTYVFDQDCAFVISPSSCLATHKGYRLILSDTELGILHPRAYPITARSIASYISMNAIPSDFETRYRNLQLLEVGAGLAEFTPHMAQRQENKPIIIDSANYPALLHLLAQSTHQPIPETQRSAVNLLIKRITTILDPKEITLYNMSLLDAVTEFPDKLRGCADVVLDVFGATLYTDGSSTKAKVEEIEQHFLSRHWWNGLT